MLQVTELMEYSADEAAEFLIDVLDTKTVIIGHPKLNIPTFARASKTIGMANVILFSDDNLENHWYFIQVTKLLEAFMVDGEFFNPSQLPAAERVKTWIEDEELEFDLATNCNTVDGLLFSQRRPFHYFYDQYVNYYKLSAIKNIDEYCFADDKCFYSETDTTTFKKVKEGGCYFFPCTQPRNLSDKDAKKMHQFLKSNTHKVEIHSELSLWLGVTGQKRSWIEQVEGYIAIVRNLSMDFSHITVMLDGWTNYEGDNSINKDDNIIYDLIERELSVIPSIKVINLINLNYKKKIAYANTCDYFVANSGTGCMVPFMMCNAKGVIHSNGRMSTFQSVYNDNVRTVPNNKILSEQSGIPMYTSYSIAWEVIYNLLMDLMGNSYRLDEPQLGINSKSVFSKLRFTNKSKPADALREIALAFDQVGDRETAYTLMCEALEQRPNGPFIKQKVNDWKPKP